MHLQGRAHASRQEASIQLYACQLGCRDGSVTEKGFDPHTLQQVREIRNVVSVEICDNQFLKRPHAYRGQIGRGPKTCLVIATAIEQNAIAVVTTEKRAKPVAHIKYG
jgi:hypothetical protein